MALATRQLPDTWGFSGGDLLGYAGALLGGLLTLVGVAMTIRHEHQEAWEERMMASAPCLVPSLLGRGELGVIPRQLASEEGAFFVLRQNDFPDIRSSLKDREFERWLSPEERTEMDGGGIAIGPIRIAAFAFANENVGLGPAINYRVRIVPSSYRETEPTDRATGNAALRVGDSYCVAVYCDTHCPSASGKYKLELTYLDLYGYRYSDYFDFEISDDGQQISIKAMVSPTRSIRPEPKD